MTSTAAEKHLLSSEVAAELRLPDSTLRYWRSIGEGPPWARLGKRVIYRESDVRRWLAEQFAKSVGGGAPAA